MTTARMSTSQARVLLTKSSLALLGATLVFFTCAPFWGFPLAFDDAMTVAKLIAPLLLGYLSAASYFAFQPNRGRPDTRLSELAALLVKVPVPLTAVMLTVVIATFWRSQQPPFTGDGMTPPELQTAVTAALGLLAATTSVAVTHLFSVDSESTIPGGAAVTAAPASAREDGEGPRAA